MNSRPIFNRRTIGYPLIRLIVLAVLVGIGLALLSDAFLTFDNVREEIRRTLTSAANAAGTAASAALVFNDAKVAHAVLRMFEAYPEVEAAALYTDEGARLASYGDPGLLPSDARDLGPSTPDIALLAETVTLHRAIEIDDGAVGSVYLRARLDRYWQTYFTSIAVTFLVALSAGTLALIMAIRFLGRLILPIRRLAEAANDARLRNDFTPRDIPAGDDELGDLVRNFNALLAEVDASRKALQDQHNLLERAVAERTAELLAAKDTADGANTAKSRFLAAASHDLRQPIHAMRLFLETLSDTPLNEEQQRFTNYLSLSARNLADILNALLDVSKLDSGAVKPHFETVRAYDLIRQIDAEFAPLALAKGLRFKLAYPNGELLLFTDAKLFGGLLRNLIDNAIKYTETGGILVGFRRRPGSALIQVWDTGIGIAPEHLGAIYDEYFQVGNPQRDRAKGLGLGLANAKRLANLLGCPLRCDSRPGRGSRFEISVPLADEADHEAGDILDNPTDDMAIPPSLASCRVTLVEDDWMVAMATELSLASYGLEVTTFHSAAEALADTRSEETDFYIVDYRLPGLNGVQFLDALQKRTKQPIKAVLLTGETYQGVVDSVSPCRWKVLFKPIDPAALMAEIEAQCRPRRTPGQHPPEAAEPHTNGNWTSPYSGNSAAV